MIIRRENKTTVILCFLVVMYLFIETYFVITLMQENLDLQEVIRMNLRVNQDMSIQMNSCVDMLKVYQKQGLDLYADPD